VKTNKDRHILQRRKSPAWTLVSGDIRFVRIFGRVLSASELGSPQVCRRNCSDICHTVGDVSTSGLDGHVAISGYPSMSHLFADTFFEFGVVENFVYPASITVILTSDLSGSMSL